MKDLITEARELIEALHAGEYDDEYIGTGAYLMLDELCDALGKAEKRISLLEGAIDRQNNTIAYLNSTNGQEFNW